jgi:hypothetical protein
MDGVQKGKGQGTVRLFESIQAKYFLFELRLLNKVRFKSITYSILEKLTD